MAATLTSAEEAQLQQTIDMFKVIVQSQPLDYQSLEILKEAYMKLGRQEDVTATSKQIAGAYMQLGQLSSAIMEYETILQQLPDDPDVKKALEEIESKTTSFSSHADAAPEEARPKSGLGSSLGGDIDDGKARMRQIFVDGKIINSEDFEKLWPIPSTPLPGQIPEPFIQLMADKGILPIEQSLKLVLEKSRSGYIPIDKYEVDMELARSFPAAVCQKWCVLPFDRMSKTTLVATANPFNKQAQKEVEEALESRVQWYFAVPSELVKTLRKAYR